MSYQAHQDSQCLAIQKIINGLMHELHKLAPHPDQPQNKGPLFIKSNPLFKVANDRDSMLGNMIMESILGAAFSEAVSEISDNFGSWTQDFDAGTVLELYDVYRTEIEEDNNKIAAHGQGTMARMSGKSIANSFNMRGNLDEPLQAFMDDMPKRMKIERDLAYYARELEHLMVAPALEAPSIAA